MEVAAADGYITCADGAGARQAESGVIGRLELAREYNNPPPIAHFLLRSMVSCHAELSRDVDGAYDGSIWCGTGMDVSALNVNVCFSTVDSTLCQVFRCDVCPYPTTVHCSR